MWNALLSVIAVVISTLDPIHFSLQLKHAANQICLVADVVDLAVVRSQSSGDYKTRIPKPRNQSGQSKVAK